jgi:hypothetical protein
LKSPSSPWPIASWSRTPHQPGPSTTGISPAGRGNAFEIDQRLGQRLVDRAVPGRWIEQPVVEIAPAEAEAAGLPPVALLGDDRDVEAHQRADVGRTEAIGADDLDHRPAARQRNADLSHARVAGAAAASIAWHSSTFLANGIADSGSSAPYIAGWCAAAGPPAALAGSSSLQGLRRPLDRLGADLIGVGEGGHLAGHAAQAEARSV